MAYTYLNNKRPRSAQLIVTWRISSSKNDKTDGQFKLFCMHNNIQCRLTGSSTECNKAKLIYWLITQLTKTLWVKLSPHRTNSCFPCLSLLKTHVKLLLNKSQTNADNWVEVQLYSVITCNILHFNKINEHCQISFYWKLPVKEHYLQKCKFISLSEQLHYY